MGVVSMYQLAQLLFLLPILTYLLDTRALLALGPVAAQRIGKVEWAVRFVSIAISFMVCFILTDASLARIVYAAAAEVVLAVTLLATLPLFIRWGIRLYPHLLACLASTTSCLFNLLPTLLHRTPHVVKDPVEGGIAGVAPINSTGEQSRRTVPTRGVSLADLAGLANLPANRLVQGASGLDSSSTGSAGGENDRNLQPPLRVFSAPTRPFVPTPLSSELEGGHVGAGQGPPTQGGAGIGSGTGSRGVDESGDLRGLAIATMARAVADELWLGNGRFAPLSFLCGGDLWAVVIADCRGPLPFLLACAAPATAMRGSGGSGSRSSTRSSSYKHVRALDFISAFYAGVFVGQSVLTRRLLGRGPSIARTVKGSAGTVKGSAMPRGHVRAPLGGWYRLPVCIKPLGLLDLQGNRVAVSLTHQGTGDDHLNVGDGANMFHLGAHWQGAGQATGQDARRGRVIPSSGLSISDRGDLHSVGPVLFAPASGCRDSAFALNNVYFRVDLLDPVNTVHSEATLSEGGLDSAGSGDKGIAGESVNPRLSQSVYFFSGHAILGAMLLRVANTAVLAVVAVLLLKLT